MSNGPELDGLVRVRCQRNGCTAEVLLGHTRHGTPVVLDARTERRGVVQRVVLVDTAGETAGIGQRIVFHDTYVPHRFSCAARTEVPSPADGLSVAAQNGGSTT